MNQDIIDRCVAALAEEDLDAIIAMTPENFAYVTGFIVPSQPILRWRHAAAVITRDGRRALFTVDMEASTVKDLEPDEDVRVWEEFEGDAMPVLRRPPPRSGYRSGTDRHRDRLPAGP